MATSQPFTHSSAQPILQSLLLSLVTSTALHARLVCLDEVAHQSLRTRHAHVSHSRLPTSNHAERIHASECCCTPRAPYKNYARDSSVQTVTHAFELTRCSLPTLRSLHPQRCDASLLKMPRIAANSHSLQCYTAHSFVSSHQDTGTTSSHPACENYSAFPTCIYANQATAQGS